MWAPLVVWAAVVEAPMPWLRPLRWALALSLLTACGAAAPPPPSDTGHALHGKALPAFERPALDGTKVSTAALVGKPVVLEVFASYCEPCKRTLPKAAAFAKERPDVAVIGIGEDEAESDVRRMAESHGVTFPVLHDRGNVLAGRLRVNELPALFVVDKQGIVRWVKIGDTGGEVDLGAIVDGLR